jgi:hypothetical protein
MPPALTVTKTLKAEYFYFRPPTRDKQFVMPGVLRLSQILWLLMHAQGLYKESRPV